MKDSNQNLIIRNLNNSSNGGNIILGVSNTPNAFMISSNNGFIGIGTTNPRSNLHVVGDVGIFGSLSLKVLRLRLNSTYFTTKTTTTNDQNKIYPFRFFNLYRIILSCVYCLSSSVKH